MNVLHLARAHSVSPMHHFSNIFHYIHKYSHVNGKIILGFDPVHFKIKRELRRERYLQQTESVAAQEKESAITVTPSVTEMTLNCEPILFSRDYLKPVEFLTEDEDGTERFCLQSITSEHNLIMENFFVFIMQRLKSGVPLEELFLRHELVYLYEKLHTYDGARLYPFVQLDKELIPLEPEINKFFDLQEDGHSPFISSCISQKSC